MKMKKMFKDGTLVLKLLVMISKIIFINSIKDSRTGTENLIQYQNLEIQILLVIYMVSQIS